MPYVTIYKDPQKDNGPRKWLNEHGIVPAICSTYLPDNVTPVAEYWIEDEQMALLFALKWA